MEQRNATNASFYCSFLQHFSEQESIVQVSALSALLVLSLVGNVLVIFVVLRSNKRGNHLFFMMNMAVSDMIVPLVVLPNHIVIYYTKTRTWPFDGILGDLTCKTHRWLENMSPCVSILTLISLAIDRFCAIALAARVKLITAKARKLMITATWLISSATNSLYLYAMRVERNEAGSVNCVFKWSDSHTHLDAVNANNIYMTFNLLFYFITPMLLLTVLYSVILVKLKTKNQVHSSEMAKKRLEIAKRITIMTVFIVGLFGLLWGPHFTIMSLVAFYWNWEYPPICSWPTIILTVRFLALSHAAINPFLCLIFVEKYRRNVTTALARAKNAVFSMVVPGTTGTFSLEH